MDIDMDIKELEAFVYVVENCSFSRAAELLHLTQPTISSHVSALERKLNIKLIVRTTKETYPSDAGKLLYKYAKEILQVRENAAIALCPGISRSGMTITAGCFTGFERKFAVRFAFLLSIPAVLGANILTLKDAIDTGIDFSSVPVYLVGVVVAAVSGYASIRLLRYVADKGRFGAFAYYCWAAGVLTLVLTILH